MNRLWVRLSLAFTAVVLLGFGAVVFGTFSLTSDQRMQSLLLNQFERPHGLVDSAAKYYKAHGGWAGVDTLMDGARSTLLPGSGGRGALLLLDAAGQVVYSSLPPERLPATPSRQGRPIMLDGKLVGRIDFVASPDTTPNAYAAWSRTSPSDFIQEVTFFLLQIALIVGVLGLIFGVLASRGLAAPLNRLAVAAQAIGARNLDYRVPVQGSTEVREVAESFNKMAADLQSAESLRRNLLADVAHELRTPLTVLQGNLQAILEDVYPLDKSEMVRLHDQTRHLHRLVNDLHELAQAEAHQLPLLKQPLNAVGLAQEAVELFAPVAEEKGVALGLAADTSAAAIQGDRARLMQVLQNLLHNALRHTPENGEIEVAVVSRGGGVEIAVTDSGEGITAEDLPHIFERFYRSGKARDRDSGGTGLGLAIVRALVEAHDGQVQVTSGGKGMGSRFVIHLP
ncbi:MAG: HAMP domain-containing protein [Caldilineaceae bacterium]|nr:HAMP domain-containing protein [Caldilineaceae bacterium]HRJ40897.1 ATP-binding protein [Caldilineaceae bacterium]